jgi:hypothetical protein
MLSARGAELTAIKFYRDLGYEVEDISIKQLNKNGSEWINFDISLDNKIKIDIKNARTSINNPNGYSEIYVPQYKTDRKGNAVRIAGVLSPACPACLDGKDLKPYLGTTHDITFLGETFLEGIQALEEKYKHQGILELTLSRDGDNHFIAPWLFDYPEPFYRKRNTWRSEIAQFKDEDIAVVKSLFNLDFSDAFIMAGKKLPADITEIFDSWTRDFYERLISEDIFSLTLPKLFLLVLTEFLEQAKKNQNKEYNPINYKNVLYSSENIHPLGIYDPLDIINKLVDSLNILWANNKKLDYSLFTGFKLTGKGLLQGRHSNGFTYTLLAYCGGRTNANVACGKTPLIYGREKTCICCGYLICSEKDCRFCSKHCCIPKLDNILKYQVYVKELELPHYFSDTKITNFKESLHRKIPHIALNSETAKREFLISPLLFLLMDYVEFDIDIKYSMNINESPLSTIYYVSNSLQNFIIVEAPNSDFIKGFTQLAIELIGFSQNNDLLYGAVTDGNAWQFGVLDVQNKTVLKDTYSFLVPSDLEELCAVLLGILQA